MYQMEVQMKIIVLFSMIVISISAFSQSKEEVSKMLEQMKAQGMFSEEDLKKAKAKLDKMDSADFNNIVEKANSAAQDPEVLKKVKELQKQSK
jgi:predicted Zn-dependent peptidase